MTVPIITSLLVIILGTYLLRLLCRKSGSGYLRRTRRTGAVVNRPPCHYRTARKPAWVRSAIIRLKALHPDAGCRKIADHFNRQFAAHRGMTVSKSYVAGIFRKYAYAIRVQRNRIHHRLGKPGPTMRILGLDLTGKTDEAGLLHMILGLVDHGSRANLALKTLETKSSIAILRVLLDVIEKYGKPTIIRTDNERIFTSRLFRFGLTVLGIQHQTTDLHCPWMNGRIERFFLTLKQKLDRWAVPDAQSLDQSLATFRLWYNHLRPHQHLDGRTPAEVWNGTDVYRRRSTKTQWFSAWDGLLTGYYLPP